MHQFVFTRNILSKEVPYRWLFQTSKHHYSNVRTSSFFSSLFLTTKTDINIRTMTKEDLGMVMKWATREGWRPGTYEVESLHAADPQGYRLLEVNGQPVASLACVRHSPTFAFLGLYMVHPKYRGLGYGKLLWDVSMGTLKDCSTIGLNALKNQVANYEKSDFKSATLNTRWFGHFNHKEGEKQPPILLEKPIELVKNVSLTNIIDYDTSIFSTPRQAFLSKWLKMPESHVLAAIDSGRLVGYGVVSKTTAGYKIAPLFADSPAIAKQLLSSLTKNISKKNIVHIDIPDNAFSSTMVKHFGLKKDFETLRMYRGTSPQMDEQKIFGLTSLEIG